MRDFKRRKFCNKKHSSLFQHNQKTPPQPNKIKPAVEQIEKGSKEQKLTAIEYLSQLVNDEKEDTITRMNAAKALAPYESKKASEKPSKGQEREEKAKKASTGRFSAGKAPVQRVK